MSDPASELREYLKWLAGYAAVPGDSAFDRRLKMAERSVDRLAQARAESAERNRMCEPPNHYMYSPPGSCMCGEMRMDPA